MKIAIIGLTLLGAVICVINFIRKLIRRFMYYDVANLSDISTYTPPEGPFVDPPNWANSEDEFKWWQAEVLDNLKETQEAQEKTQDELEGFCTK